MYSVKLRFAVYCHKDYRRLVLTSTDRLPHCVQCEIMSECIGLCVRACARARARAHKAMSDTTEPLVLRIIWTLFKLMQVCFTGH